MGVAVSLEDKRVKRLRGERGSRSRWRCETNDFSTLFISLCSVARRGVNDIILF